MQDKSAKTYRFGILNIDYLWAWIVYDMYSKKSSQSWELFPIIIGQWIQVKKI